jgi:prepilin-type processing-associated H-X9-DG protein
MRAAVSALLVVLILLLTGGIVAVSVAKLREADARIRCQNNLKQIGLALHNYHYSHDRFPLAAMDEPAGLPPEQRFSWLFAIVPYVEAENLSKRMDRDKGWAAEENRFFALMRNRIVECPRQAGRPLPSTLFPTSYVGIAGLGDDALTLPAESDRAGAFGYDRPLKMADIPNAGALLLVVETAQVRGAWTAAGPPTARGVELDAPAYLGPDAPFGGLHRDGANALFADGSVRFLKNAVDPEAFRAAVLVRASKDLDVTVWD